MRNTHLLLPLLLSLPASAQDYLGVNTWGGTDSDQLNAVALDGTGNIFAFGGFWGTADMDPGAGTTSFTALAVQDMFLSRFTPEGVFEWSIQLRGTDHDHANSVAAKDNSVWVGGGFEDSLDVQPTAATQWQVSNGDEDAVVARYTNDGQLIWAATAGSTGADYVNDIAVDTQGNVIAIGYFQGTVDFDPGPNQTLVSAGGSDAMFLWKLGPNGALVWVRTWNGTSSENGTAVAAGAGDDLWIGGSYFGTLDLDPGNGTTSVTAPGFNDNAFLIHLTEAGAFLSGGHMGGNGNDILRDLRIASNGDAIAVGQFSEDGDYDPGPNVSMITTAGNYDSFVVKLSTSGAFVWAGSFGGPSYDDAEAIALGPLDEMLITGGFDATADLDPGPDVFEVVGNGVSDVYSLTLDSTGQFLNAIAWGGTGLDMGMTAAWSGSGRQFIGGSFELTVDFDPGPGTDVISSVVSSRDAFLTRLCSPYSAHLDTLICLGDSLFAAGEWQYASGIFTDPFISASGCDSIVVTFLTVEVCAGLLASNKGEGLLLYPVPSHDLLHLTLPSSTGPMLYTVRDALGRILIQQAVVAGPVLALDIATLPQGSYTLHFEGPGGRTTYRFVKE
ncbi:MAG: T9SS type A sorting domain-containing protein [Flavobacteriales bacterium]